MDTQENQPAKATNQTESFKQNEIAPTNTEALSSLTTGSSFDTNEQRKQATQQEVEKKTIPALSIDFGSNPESAALSGTQATPVEGQKERAGSTEKPSQPGSEAPAEREGRSQFSRGVVGNPESDRGAIAEVNPAAPQAAETLQHAGHSHGHGHGGRRFQGREAQHARVGRDQRPGREGRDQRPGQGKPEQGRGHDGPERPGRGDVGQAEESPMKVDRKPSAKFVSEATQATESVRQQMPANIREALKDVEVTPVKSIKDKQSGDTVNGAFDENELLIAEKRAGNAKLESIIKHEFGHAFSASEKNGKLMSQDPEFRKLVDKATPRGSELEQIRKEDRDSYYEEVFADLFASNIKAPSRDLAIPNLDRRMPDATDWVKRRMQR